MTFTNGLLKFFAYLFHLSLCTFLIGAAILAATSHSALRLEMLPLNQERMISRASMVSLLGFLCMFLAVIRIFEFVFPLYSLAVVVLFAWGFFFTPYSFTGPIGLGWALLLILASILALYGSILVLMPTRRRNRW
jgi:hypothetical protein